MIHVSGLSFEYPLGLQALRDINLNIETGERIAVIGSNGSGKSTLARCLNGLCLPQAGFVEVDGVRSDDRDARSQLPRLVGMVFQNPDDQILSTTVEDEVAFGLENLGIEPQEMKHRVADILDIFDLLEVRHHSPHCLSGGEKQRVAIAACVAMHPRYLILDEPSSLLDPTGRREVATLLDTLHREGVATIHVTQLAEEAATADRIIVIHEGQLLFDDVPPRIFERRRDLEKIGLQTPFATALATELKISKAGLHPDAPLNVGDLARTISSHLTANPASLPQPTFAAPHAAESNQDTPTTPMLSTHDLSYSYADGRGQLVEALREVNVEFRAGSAVAVVGASGSGKTTLAQHLNGLLEPHGGRVLLDGTDIWSSGLAKLPQLRRRVGLVFQFPELQLFGDTLFEDVAFGPRNLGIAEREVDEIVRQVLDSVHLPYEIFAERSPLSLSYGEKRLAAIAGVLALRPKVLVLDEPTAGLDPAMTQSLLSILQQFRDEGNTLLFITHDVRVVAELADYVVALRDGAISMIAETRQALTDPELERIAGMAAPEPVVLLRMLCELGHQLPIDRITLREVTELLAPQIQTGDGDDV